MQFNIYRRMAIAMIGIQVSKTPSMVWTLSLSQNIILTLEIDFSLLLLSLDVYLFIYQ